MRGLSRRGSPVAGPVEVVVVLVLVLVVVLVLVLVLVTRRVARFACHP